MGKPDEDKKPTEVKEAEQHGGETFTPEAEATDNEQQDQAKAEDTRRDCVDCDGEGIRNPNDHQVCQTCQGTGKA